MAICYGSNINPIRDGVVAVMGTPEWKQGGKLDTCAPSAGFVAALDTVSGPGRRCAGLDDDAVTGVLAGWARVEAWAVWAKLATVTELVRRRGIPGTGTGIGTGTGAGGEDAGAADAGGAGVPRAWDDTLTEEIAPALGMSRQAAVKLIGLAVALAARLDVTAAALAAGEVDYLKAKIIAEATGPLDDQAAGNAEKLALQWAGGTFAGKTPGEIGRLIDRAVIAADPCGAQKRREAAERTARVQTWRESTGTMAMMGCGLNPQAAMEAEQAITARARQYKKAGLAGDMDSLRARAMLDRLAGRNPLAAAGEAGAGAGAGGLAGTGGLAAEVNLTLSVLDLPLMSLLQLADKPGEAAGWGALDPALVRDLAAAAAAGERSRWHLTLTDQHGRAVSHGCAARDRGTKPGKEWVFTMNPVPVHDCDHRYESKGHDPGPLLRHLTEIRDGTCTHPSCARPATRADFEHTIPYQNGGRTCGCNGNAKCRRDHQIKQHPRWTVTQPAPGYNQWRTPSGRTYTQEPKQYPS